MNDKKTSDINGYHAHVYYDAQTKARAAVLREAIESSFDVKLGRWRDEPVGPHPCPSFQVAFAPAQFAELVPWLALNRDGLVVFVHPETGDDVPDHQDFAIWMGGMPELNLDVFG